MNVIFLLVFNEYNIEVLNYIYAAGRAVVGVRGQLTTSPGTYPHWTGRGSETFWGKGFIVQGGF